MKIDPKGRTPPTRTITQGSMNHFFSGIGLGTAFILKMNTFIFSILLNSLKFKEKLNVGKFLIKGNVHVSVKTHED